MDFHIKIIVHFSWSYLIKNRVDRPSLIKSTRMVSSDERTQNVKKMKSIK